MTLKKRGLGRNLEALLGDLHTISDTKQTPIEGELRQIELHHIHAGKYQPRQDFPEQALQELANSIRAQGIIQPIIVRSQGSGQFEIIAGERRFRAAKLAGLTTVPALVRELPDEAAVAIALIENIQREDLNPIEEAIALQRLIGEFSLTHEQVANAVGKSRAAVSNLLRLLALPDFIKQMLAAGKLEMGHARALLSLSAEEQTKLAKIIAENNLSVRETEDYVRKSMGSQQKTPKTVEKSAFSHATQQRLVQHFGLPVVIQQNAKGRGKLIIKYKNAKQLELALEKMGLV